MRALPLADELFLFGHHEYTGKPAVSTEVLQTGLAGAVLGELLLVGRLAIVEGKVLVRDPRPYGDAVSDGAMLAVLQKGDGYVVRAWIEYLRDDARATVGQRVIDRGLVRREEGRAGLARRLQVRYPGVDPLECTRPRVRLGYVVSRGLASVDAQTATLAGLVQATGLESLLVGEVGRQAARQRLAEYADQLTAPLHALVTGVDSAVAAIALTVRR